MAIVADQPNKLQANILSAPSQFQAKTKTKVPYFQLHLEGGGGGGLFRGGGGGGAISGVGGYCLGAAIFPFTVFGCYFGEI
jgi:hypothetical protein